MNGIESYYMKQSNKSTEQSRCFAWQPFALSHEHFSNTNYFVEKWLSNAEFIQ